MDKSRAVFWLGTLERRYARQASNGLRDQQGVLRNEVVRSLEACRPCSRDTKLVEEVLDLFDSMMDNLDGERDHQTSALIDQLALAVMASIRAHLRAKSSY